jgi:hypothetical protein
LMRSEALFAADQLSDAVDPATMLLRDRLTAFADSLFTLHVEMLTRLDELITRDAMLAIRDDPEYGDERSVHLPAAQSGMRVIVEGRSAADPSATLSVDCGMFDVTVEVRDEETSALVYSGAMFGPTSHTLPALRVDDPNLLRVELLRVDAGPGWGTPCRVGVFGRRRWRGPAIPLGAAEFDMVMFHAANFDVQMTELDREIMAARGSTDPELLQLLDYVERVVTDVSFDSGRWRTIPDHVDQDDLELIQLTNRVNDAALAALAASPQLARPELPTAVAKINQIRTENQTGITLIGP